ncbi:RES domain-containing protein [Ketogulonicigenium vulgare]|uniref:RES domain-containing protein n=1 Tax=Ketogulonicigenium vulgare TaxID=92945 RepID=UPI0023587DD1|nr:RES domain-containing protein [Ketogulonicigenium vulgare]
MVDDSGGRLYAAGWHPPHLVPLQADQLWLFDPRDTDEAAALGVDPAWSQASWQGALAERRAPPSWQIADAARRAGADGIIDPSRQIAGGWHVTLFRWDNVRVAGPGVLLPQ